MILKTKKILMGSLVGIVSVGTSLAIAIPLALSKKGTEVKKQDIDLATANKVISDIKALIINDTVKASNGSTTPAHVAFEEYDTTSSIEDKIGWIDEQANLNLLSIPNITTSLTNITSKLKGNTIEVIISSTNATNGSPYKFTITSYLPEKASLANETHHIISDFLKPSTIVVANKSVSNAVNAANDIKSIAKFNEYSGKDLNNHHITDKQIHISAKAVSKTVQVSIKVVDSTKPDIKYTITGFTS